MYINLHTLIDNKKLLKIIKGEKKRKGEKQSEKEYIEKATRKRK